MEPEGLRTLQFMASTFEESPQNPAFQSDAKSCRLSPPARLSQFYGNKIISASLFENCVRQRAEGMEYTYKSARSELNERECISREDKLKWEKRGNKVIPVCALFLGRISLRERRKERERTPAWIIAIKKTPEGIFIIPRRARELCANPLPA
jgi:hypothetical protein